MATCPKCQHVFDDSQVAQVKPLSNKLNKYIKPDGTEWGYIQSEEETLTLPKAGITVTREDVYKAELAKSKLHSSGTGK